MDDIFSYMREENLRSKAPLAARMRPRTIDEVVGQESIIGPGTLLRRAIETDRMSSVILYGPPGCGKTTIAKVIANTTRARFVQISAVSSGKKDMEQAISDAKDALGMYGRRTIIFIDEIHRFNKAQQDYLLPFVEDGTAVLIGATTENPYFEVNKALISRSMLFKLESLTRADVRSLLERALADEERGLAAFNAAADDAALDLLADISGGDARAALNALELGVLSTPRSGDGKIHITVEVAKECIQRRNITYDKDGDSHYDTISAFIKSMRGSDPDAAVYYLARMLEAGEDIRFIARRIMICAAEDVGNADPQALQVAASAAYAADQVGMPEARIPLSQAAIYVACAPKSNASYLAVDAAMKSVRSENIKTIPPHLKDSHYSGSAALGNGLDYKYAHNYKDHYVTQQYLPDELEGRTFYDPTGQGYEQTIARRLEYLRSTDHSGD